VIEPTAEERANLRAGTDLLTEDELDLLDRYLATRLRLSQMRLALTKVKENLLRTQEEVTQSINKVRLAYDEYDRTKLRLAKNTAEFESHQARLRSAAVETYMAGGVGSSSASALLKVQTVDDLTRGQVYVRAVVDDEQELVTKYDELRNYVDELSGLSEIQRAAAESARDAQLARQDDATRQVDEVQAATTAEQEAFEQQTALIAEIAAKNADYQKRISEQDQRSGSVEQTLANAQRDQEGPPDELALFAYFQHPVPAARLTQKFGPRIHPIFGGTRGHQGIDLAISTGTPILAAEDGFVVLATESDYGGYGKCVIIDHGNKVGSLYAHQSQLAVAVGDYVRRGDVIGFIGSTGYSTGPHLHWEVRLAGYAVDPERLIGTR